MKTLFFILYSTRSQSALFDVGATSSVSKKCRTAWQAASALFFRLPRLAQKCAVKNAHILTALSIVFSVTGFATPTDQNKGSLDSDFFEPKKDTTPTTSKGTITGTERQLVDAPRDYNQPQYESWVEQCQPKKTDLNNPRAFSDCVRQKRSENREELRKKFQTVEDDQNIPLKKIPLLEDVERKPTEDTDE